MSLYLTNILEQNAIWAKKQIDLDKDFFNRLVDQQTPEYLWIGCSDSRVPANQISDMAPGEIFVHRNIANVVVHSDLNLLSVLQFAVDVLKVKHVVVCGHYGCGGVKAATLKESHGLIDNWLRHIQDIRDKHQDLIDRSLSKVTDVVTRESTLLDIMCELNVIEQAVNICQTTIIRDAWARGQPVSVNGMIYGLKDGRIKQLCYGVTQADEVMDYHKQAVAEVISL